MVSPMLVGIKQLESMIFAKIVIDTLQRGLKNIIHNKGKRSENE
jgi:hypothetical protein